MGNFQYTTNTSKNFEAAVSAIEQQSAKKGFRVLHTHDVSGTLAEKGFKQEPLKIIEVCNARYANEALNKNIEVAVMLPCPIAVYTKDGKTFISTMRPSAIAEFYPGEGMEEVAAEVEKAVMSIIDEAK